MANHFLCPLLAGNEEVKLAILSAVASWAARCSDTIQADLVSFLTSGLKEKEALRRGHLRCLRVMSKNSDIVLQVSRQLIASFFRFWYLNID